MKFKKNSWAFPTVSLFMPLIAEEKQPLRIKENNPQFGICSQLNNVSESPAELCKQKMGSVSVEVLIQFVLSSAMEFVFLIRSQVKLMLTVPGPDFGKHWSRVDLLVLCEKPP